MAYFPTDPRDIQLTLNDFPLYGEDSNNVEWHTTFQNTTGIFDGVASTLQTATKAWTDGWFSNIPTREGRTITITGELMGACPEDLVRSWKAFLGVFNVGDNTFEVKLGDIDWQTTVMQSTSAPLLKWTGLTTLQWSISLTALSSYFESAGAPLTGSTGLPQTVGGMTFPYHFEADSTWVFNETVTSGSINLTSNGTAPSPVTMRIDGDVLDPAVEYLQTGKVMGVTGEIGANHYMTFNGATHEILMDDADPVNGMITRREWAQAQPGQNTWQFRASKFSASAKLTISFREDYV